MMQPSNWLAALRALEPRLVCPRCDAVNYAFVITVRISDDGRSARCDDCGVYGDLHLFLPPLDPKREMH